MPWLYNEKFEGQVKENREEKVERNTRNLVRLLKKEGVRVGHQKEIEKYKGDFDIGKMVIFGLSLMGISKREIAKRTGQTIQRISKLSSMYEEQFFGDMAVQGAIRGTKAKLLKLLDPAYEAIKHHVTNFDDPKNYEAAKDLLTTLGAYERGTGVVGGRRPGEVEITLKADAEFLEEWNRRKSWIDAVPTEMRVETG